MPRLSKGPGGCCPNLQVSIYSLLLSPDPELLWMEGEHTQRLWTFRATPEQAQVSPRAGTLEPVSGEPGDSGRGQAHFQEAGGEGPLQGGSIS